MHSTLRLAAAAMLSFAMAAQATTVTLPADISRCDDEYNRRMHNMYRLASASSSVVIDGEELNVRDEPRSPQFFPQLFAQVMQDVAEVRRDQRAGKLNARQTCEQMLIHVAHADAIVRQYKNVPPGKY